METHIAIKKGARPCYKPGVFSDVKCDQNMISLIPTHKSTRIFQNPKKVESYANKIKGKESRLGDPENPRDAYDYDLEIYHYLKKIEMKRQPIPNYFDYQTTIRPRMRAIVIDWLIGVHFHMEMHTDTLYTAVTIGDLFLSKVDLHRSKLQLLFCTALFMAAKMEEIELPSLKDFIYFTKNSFTEEDMTKMESSVFTVIEFSNNVIHSSTFLKRFLRLYPNPTLEISMLAHYINESMLLEEKLIGVPPSTRAAAVICLTLGIERGPKAWNSFLADNTGYTVTDLQPLVNTILTSLKQIKSKFSASVKKYDHDYFESVSRIELPESMIFE